MKKMLYWFFVIFMILIIAVPGSCFAGQSLTNLTDADIDELREDTNFFDEVISTLLLNVGDYAHDFVSKVFKEDITIDALVYNKASLTNANFFTESSNASRSTTTETIRTLINKWYDLFRSITLLFCLTALVLAGIKIILNNPDSKIQAMDIFKKIIIAFALVFLFPYVMKMGFDLNEAIVNTVYNQFHTTNSLVGVALSEVSDLKPEDLEFRSPEYVSKRTLVVSAGTDEATKLFLSKLEKYAESADVMRIMRAIAGVTLKVLFCVIWYIMIWQLYLLAYTYIKRYITIAFLLAIYPLTVIGYVSGSLMGKAQTAFNEWCKKFFSNIFIQSIHAITYGVICGVLISQVKSGLNEGMDKINWILMIIATSFLFTGEKILTKIWNAGITTDAKGEMKNIFSAPKRFVKRLIGK